MNSIIILYPLVQHWQPSTKPTNLNPIDFLQNNPNSMAIRQIEDMEVINIINSLNNSCPGWDGIPSILTKKRH